LPTQTGHPFPSAETEPFMSYFYSKTAWIRPCRLMHVKVLSCKDTLVCMDIPDPYGYAWFVWICLIRMDMLIFGLTCYIPSLCLIPCTPS
jgi:hypothetical protein